MGLFESIKKAISTGVRQVSAEYGKTDDFLNAVCASAALVAMADGKIEDSERTKAISLVRNHTQLSKLYNGDKIETTIDRMLKLSADMSGRQELARNLEKVKNLEGSKAMCEDVYLVAADIASADGNVDPKEEEVLKKIAGRLGVDPSKFEF